MIPEECFFRHMFQVTKGRKTPLCDIASNVALSFTWGIDTLSFILSERSSAPFSPPKKNLADVWTKSHRNGLDGDACILFIDTRPQRKSRSMNKHCHQFLILPEAIQGVQSKEITKFSSYETRALVKDNLLRVRIAYTKNLRSYDIEIPRDCLYGWEEETKEVSFAVSYYSKEQQEVIRFPIPSVLPERIPYVWPLIKVS